MSLVTAGQIIWVIGIVAWYVIRYPFERRAKKVRVVSDRRSSSETIGLASALLGMAVLPAIHVATGLFGFADYPARPWALALGTAAFAGALWTFRRAHKDLGRNWSITLQIREEHRLVTGGLYRLVRHPMYTSFLLMAVGQAFLLANWIAGLSGLAGVAVLFFLRVDKEERMMLETFGDEYRAYMKTTKRIIPYLY